MGILKLWIKLCLTLWSTYYINGNQATTIAELSGNLLIFILDLTLSITSQENPQKWQMNVPKTEKDKWGIISLTILLPNSQVVPIPVSLCHQFPLILNPLFRCWKQLGSGFCKVLELNSRVCQNEGFNKVLNNFKQLCHSSNMPTFQP